MDFHTDGFGLSSKPENSSENHQNRHLGGRLPKTSGELLLKDFRASTKDRRMSFDDLTIHQEGDVTSNLDLQDLHIFSTQW